MSNIPNTIAQRSFSADFLKVISIFAVVFVHGSFLIPFTPSYLKWMVPVMRFCVPVFILLWAYFVEKSIAKRENGYEYLFTRFYHLLIPFIFWSSVYFALTADWSSLNLAKIITMHWSGYGWSGQYYFIILFQLIPLFLIIRFISSFLLNRLWLVVVISILFYSFIAYSSLFDIGSVKKVSDRLFIYWIPYVITGILLAKKGIPSKFVIPIIAALLLLLLIPVEVYLTPNHTIKSTPYLLPSVFISSIILAVSFLQKPLTISSINPNLRGIMDTVAKNTLGVFCLNPLIILLLKPFLLTIEPLQFWGSFIILPIISTFLIIGICLVIIYILKKIRLGILVTS
jgi:surface polysaccharide O-acyltransferase-like enzyme